MQIFNQLCNQKATMGSPYADNILEKDPHCNKNLILCLKKTINSLFLRKSISKNCFSLVGDIFDLSQLEKTKILSVKRQEID